MNNINNHVFGPVPSRRLKRSLGIDLVPYKTCSYDCIYCQLGCTTNKTVTRKEWVPLELLLEQLQKRLSEINTPPDYITLSGSGEPTLYSRLNELIDGVKKITSTPIALLTNGSLLWQPEVRQQILDVDLIVPSLDVGDEKMFQNVNRPHESITFPKMLEGLIKLREEFHNQYWLEVFLLDGYTALPAEIDKIVHCVKQIKPDRVQLNTVERPPAEEFAYVVQAKHLSQIAGLFDPPAEVVAGYQGVPEEAYSGHLDTDIITILKRRPCTLNDLSNVLGVPHNTTVKCLYHLSKENRVVTKNINGQTYYDDAPTL
jgi:wyosine [tRNA(Phe)-imidazoG37] synthetase (radical SAM superfamily)